MSQLSQRLTVYFDPRMHKVLRLKSAQKNRSISEIVNEAVALLVSQDAQDTADFDARSGEPSIEYASFVSTLRDYR